MRREFRSTILVTVVFSLFPRGAPAQEPSTSPAAGALASATWVSVRSSTTTPLRRVISLDFEGVSVRQAITEIAKRGNVAIGYGEDVTRSRARVSLKAGGLTVAQALTGILEGTGLEAYVSLTSGAVVVRAAPPQQAPAQTGTIVGRVTDAKTGAALVGATVVVDGMRHSGSTGNDGRYRLNEVPPGTYTLRVRYIGYAPGSSSVTVSPDQEATADIALEKSVQRLDEVVTTGTVAETQLKALPTPITVITSDDITRLNPQRVDELFRGTVPGMLAWNLGPDGYFTDFGTLRGSTAFSFATNAMKIYVDGIEMADPVYLTELDPNSVERIEIIRGPQASTIYGSQALNGVMQIFLKKGQRQPRPSLDLKLSAGIGQTDYSTATPFVQDHAATLSGGSGQFTYSVGGTFTGTSAYVTGYSDQNNSAYGSVHTTQGPVSIDGSVHASMKRLQPAPNPLMSPAVVGYGDSAPVNQRQNYKQQAAGLRLAVSATKSWQHRLTVGIDRAVTEIYGTAPRLRTPDDTLLVLENADEQRTSVLYSNTLQGQLGRSVLATLTSGADYWSYGNNLVLTSAPGVTGVIIPSGVTLLRLPFTNKGAYAQVQLGFRDEYFLTAGLRAEKNDLFGADEGAQWAPRVGLASTHQVGAAQLKLRASYGQSTRPPIFGASIGQPLAFGFVIAPNPVIRPELQRGFDGGVELYLPAGISLQATYYNQTAHDLIDLVLLGTEPVITEQYQNTGRIKNTGLELELDISKLGPVGLEATFSRTNSTIQQLSPTFTGDLAVGDRLRGVPKQSGGALATFTSRGFTLGAQATYIGSWQDYDFIALIRAQPFGGPDPFRGSTRDYVIDYPSVWRFNLSASQDVTPKAGVFVKVSNVTNRQLGERNNVNLTFGRTTSVGMRLRF